MNIFKRSNSRKNEINTLENEANNLHLKVIDSEKNAASDSNLSNKLNTLKDSIKTEATDVNNCAFELSSSASILKISSEKQFNEISAVSNILDGFNSNMEELALNITNVHIKALDADKLADSGLNAINDLVSSLSDLETAFNSSSSTVNDLVTKLESVNSITDSISQIATQTNLLSLNAAIEAARAGEAGRGFSVVAGEVGKLAENSKAAVHNITNILGEIKKDIIAASKTMATGTSALNVQHSSLDEAKNNFSEIKSSIVEEVKEIDTSVKNLTSAYSQKDDIISSVSNVKDTCESNNELIEGLISIINRQQKIIDSLTRKLD